MIEAVEEEKEAAGVGPGVGKVVGVAAQANVQAERAEGGAPGEEEAAELPKDGEVHVVDGKGQLLEAEKLGAKDGCCGGGEVVKVANVRVLALVLALILVEGGKLIEEKGKTGSIGGAAELGADVLQEGVLGSRAYQEDEVGIG